MTDRVDADTADHDGGHDIGLWRETHSRSRRPLLTPRPAASSIPLLDRDAEAFGLLTSTIREPNHPLARLNNGTRKLGRSDDLVTRGQGLPRLEVEPGDVADTGGSIGIAARHRKRTADGDEGETRPCRSGDAGLG